MESEWKMDRLFSAVETTILRKWILDPQKTIIMDPPRKTNGIEMENGSITFYRSHNTGKMELGPKEIIIIMAPPPPARENNGIETENGSIF